jgi:O-antigen/teichoic acid export membrane protein
MGYFKASLKGVTWVAAFRMATRIIAFIRTIILARILDPSQYGLFGVVTLVVSFLEIFTETGVNIMLIQKKEAIDKYISTAWVVSIARGILMGGVIVATASLVSSFFNNHSLIPLLYLSAFIPIIRGFINPSVVKFMKDLKFRQEFWFRFAIFTLDSAVAVTLSLILKSATGLIFGLIAGATLEVVLSHILLAPRPKLQFDKGQLKVDKEKLKEILSKSKWLTSAGIFRFSFSQGDNIVVGRMLGVAPLGIYQLAYSVSSIPISEITDVFNRVVLSVYVKIADDPKRLKLAFLKTTVAISILSSVVGLGIFLFSDIFVILLGPKWIAVIPILRILAFFGIIQAINNSMHSFLLAVEKQKYVTVITFVNTAGLLISIIPLVQRFGLIGAPYAVLIGTISALPVTIYAINQVFKEKKSP